MNEERAKVIQDLQNRQILVLDTAMQGIDQKISSLKKSLNEGLEQRDIEAEFASEVPGEAGSFLERQIVGDMDHLEESTLRKYNDDQKADQKGVKFELMEEIIGSMKHKSAVYD